MKLGLLTGVLGDLERAAAFDTCAELGLDAVELGTGEFSSDWHVGLDAVAEGGAAADELKADVSSRNLEISALSCHGNPLHPNPGYAERAGGVFEKTVRAAENLGVDTVILFAGCPGGPDGGEYPNWVSTGWPGYYEELLEWQWSERIIPFWKENAKYAADHGVRLAFEPHPGDCVFNLPTMMRLREGCGENVGVNFDPSHLWWQGMDPLVVAEELGRAGMLFHVHAKDTYIDEAAMARDGALATSAPETPGRSWRFATVGYGHDVVFWRKLVAVLRSVGYDGVLSIEHEDPLAPILEGLQRTVRLLRDALWHEPSASLSWLTDPPTLTTLEKQRASGE